MSESSDLTARFLDLHRPGRPLLLANAWDRGSARVLASLGFEALATTSAGHAGTLGRPDGGVTRDESLAHARDLVAATPLPVSADLENGFADAPDDVAETVRLAGDTGLAGLSIEDYTGNADDPIYEMDLAVSRVEAAASAARAAGLVLTARCENFLNGRPDLAGTIDRLNAYGAAGADVLYAPGLVGLDDIRAVAEGVERPVNVLCMPGGPGVEELAAAGVARISVGSAFFNVAMNALADAAREWHEQGTHGFWPAAIGGMGVTKSAFE